MTEAEETLARVRIYLRNRRTQALDAARTAPEDSPKWQWGHITSEELGTVLELMGGEG